MSNIETAIKGDQIDGFNNHADFPVVMMKKYIGIVGSSKAQHTDGMVSVVKDILLHHPVSSTVIVSGGAVGVDKIAVGIAKPLGYEVLEYLPKGKGWQYYKPRNLLIAKRCDKVYSIALSLAYNGKKCHHCANVGKDNNHFKTAGCWTAQRCKEYEVRVVG